MNCKNKRRLKEEANQLAESLNKTEEGSNQAGGSMNGILSVGLKAVGGWLAAVSFVDMIKGLFDTDIQIGETAAEIASFNGLSKQAIPEIKGLIIELANDSDASFETIGEAVRSLYSDFKIFDVSDPDGLAACLLIGVM